MDYQIVATLGPSSETDAMWRNLLEAGATAFRLNTSHLSAQQLQDWIRRLDAFFAAQERRVPVVLDLQGSKWRLGQFPAGQLADGERVTLIHAATATRAGVLPVPHGDFFRAAAVSSGEIVLDDAKLCLALESQTAGEVRARVIRGGAILPRKGITYTASTYRQESLTEADRAILEGTRHLAGVQYALSYVRDAAEMAGYRAQIDPQLRLIAKLERRPAVDEAERIAARADEVWLCRGDLGAELGMQAMAEAAHRFSEGVRGLPVPALLAGQVLEHMTEHPTPTRAEVCALHDALRQGYRGVVLSDETAIGRDPVESCRTAALFRG
jgi:pyruvate kinase